MAPGPKKSFDVEEAVETARDLFWRSGYDGTGIRDLEEAIGVGRKSLYDTFGSKQELYLRAIGKYADTVIQRMCDGLTREGSSALANLERVLGKLQRHHGGSGSLGCLLGVAMGQAGSDDEELAEVLRGALARLERAFEACLKEAQAAGDVRDDVRPKDAAHHLLALSQGIALLGRVSQGSTRSSSPIRAALAALKIPSPS
jgi:TetR/AcrR family transcriptional repressor of nem operon